ncbi:hypothetical protein FQZ97_1016380 [compost metagenome]
MGRVAQSGCAGHHLGIDAVEETETLVANGHGLGADAFGLQLLELGRQGPQHVGVHAAAQSLVGRHNDKTGGFGIVDLHEGVRVLGVSAAQVAGDLAHLFRVRPGRTHAVLRLAHFGGGDHLHGFGDLLGVLHRFDLAAYFLACCHCCSFIGSMGRFSTCRFS